MLWFILPALAATPVERVDIELTCGTVEVEGASALEISGDVAVEGDERIRVRSTAVCPTVSIRMPREARLSFGTISANLQVSGLSGRLDFDSVSGALRVHSHKHAPTRIDAHSVSGDLHVHSGKHGDVEVTSVSGKVGICGGPVHSVEASTMSAEVVIAVSTTAESHIEAESHSAPLTVRIDRAPGRLEAETFAGRILNTLTDDKPLQGLVGAQLEVDHNRGPTLELETFAGEIRLQPLSEECP